MIAEDFAAPVRVHAGRDEDDSVDDSTAFTDLHRERVRGDERERAGVVEWAVSELVDVLVELGGHP